ncbi:NADP-dependent oxidoreductase domain-containing protein [Radiomyces spectabilis]|uniref:NADP-dependent oxidoreductase domain-containing protein n=1 Tax=Radiomyces spectabilis TaxID=64574 RepID=UPI0022204734|nr:NADP-dependent oxidoreductase domain-containing protein [Radiomyces spectabilis]KAI8366674.1 NADP-dependent oxidoreductase domain-containing protein [Radiomyces spectabilis]
MQRTCRRLFTTTVKIPTTIIPKTGKPVSRIGFGAYRVSTDEHGQALRDALQAGVNVIDTGANFENGIRLCRNGAGASEKVIGKTLQDLQVERENLTLISKSGYLSSAEAALFHEKEAVQITDKSFHSLSPKVFEKQIAQSLDRLRTKKLDIFMINAPERMLTAKNKVYTLNHLYKDLETAFKYLDTLVSDGTIGGYGICSNSMALPTAVDHISLADVLKSCNQPSNFQAIQVPFNLYEREAVVPSGWDQSAQVKPVSQVAKENDIYVMTNRPLNTIANGQIRTLVNHPIEVLASGAVQLEDELSTKFVWSQVLSENLARLSQNYFAARHYLSQQVLPAVEKDLEDLDVYAEEMDAEATKAAFVDWMTNYREGMRELVDDVVSYAYVDVLRKNNELDRIMDALCPSLGRDFESAYSPLSAKTLRFLMANPNVDTVLTGMRQPRYVKDALLATQHLAVEKEDLDDVWRCPLFN